MSNFEFDLKPDDAAQWRECINTMTQNDGKAMKVTIKIMDDTRRTPPQNNAIHKWCEMLSDALNESGLDMKRVLKPEADIPWTKQAVKTMMWHPVQRAMYPEAVDSDGNPSTAALERNQVSGVYEAINRHLAQSQGFQCPPFPDRFGG